MNGINYEEIILPALSVSIVKFVVDTGYASIN